MTMMKNKNGWKMVAAMSLVAVTSLTMQTAQAAVGVPFMTAAAGDVVAPGAQAMPTLSFTFDTPYELASFTLNIDYDGDMLTFKPGDSTVSSGSFSASLVDVLGTLQAAPTGGNFSVFGPTVSKGSYSLTAFYGSGFFPIPASTVVFTAAFDVLQPLPALGTNVTFSGDLGDTGFIPTPFSEVANVTAVPEPETWMMLIGGLGLLATRIRRRKH